MDFGETGEHQQQAQKLHQESQNNEQNVEQRKEKHEEQNHENSDGLLELNDVQANIEQIEEQPIIELDKEEKNENQQDQAEQPNEQQQEQVQVQQEELLELNDVQANIVQMQEQPVIELDKKDNMENQINEQQQTLQKEVQQELVSDVQEELLELNDVQANIVQIQEQPIIELDKEDIKNENQQQQQQVEQEELLELNDVQANIVQIEEQPAIELDKNENKDIADKKEDQQEQDQLLELNDLQANIVQMEEQPIIELDVVNSIEDQKHQGNDKSNHNQSQKIQTEKQQGADEQFLESVYERVESDNNTQVLQNKSPVEEQSQFEIIDQSHHQIIKEEHEHMQSLSNDQQNANIPDQFVTPTLHFNQQNHGYEQHVEEEESKQSELRKEEGEIIDETQKLEFKQPEQENIKQSSSQKIPEQLDQKSQMIIQFQKSLDEAIFLKNQGNQWFQQKNYVKAIEQYNLAAGLCDPQYLMQCPEEQLQQFKKLRINLLSNLSACYLNLSDYNSCITHANIVIQSDQLNQKAWYRRAIAYQSKGEFEEAWRDIDAAWNLVKNSTQDKEIFDKRKEIKEQLKQANKESQVLYQTMLNNTNSTKPKTTDSKLEQSGLQKPMEQSEIISPVALNFASLVFKTTASVVLATSMTKYVLEDQLMSKTGLIETLVLGSTTASAIFFKKSWQRLSFATITAGFLAVIIFKKQSK